jgi:DNA-binding transcriptional MerR regulator
MWMAELSQRSGVSVPTIKYYLREGLLAPGVATGATRAQYDESHVRRLRLIRALTDVAGLRLETVAQVLHGIDHAHSWHEAVGSAHTRLGSAPDATPPSAASLARVQAMLDHQVWELAPGHPHALMLAHAIDALDAVGHPLSDGLLNLYAQAIRPLAAYEVMTVRDAAGPDLEPSVEAVVVGTLLQEPVLLAIRRIAQENVSRQLEGGS